MTRLVQSYRFTAFDVTRGGEQRHVSRINRDKRFQRYSRWSPENR
ncbi:hypothetical protein [Stieleria mannarensis]|nr:hypothetical protein [Rhodopirellula sp. JC639]